MIAAAVVRLFSGVGTINAVIKPLLQKKKSRAFTQGNSNDINNRHTLSQDFLFTHKPTSTLISLNQVNSKCAPHSTTHIHTYIAFINKLS